MTEQEMKKLGRGDLLELLLTQGKENETLRSRLQEAEKKLSDRQIKIDESGSLAEAVLQINGMIEAAQKTADQYLENIRSRYADQESACAKLEEESRRKAETMVQEAEEKAKAMLSEAEEKSTAMVREAEEKAAAAEAEAKANSEKYWNDVSVKMEEFYQNHLGLKELLSVISKGN